MPTARLRLPDYPALPSWGALLLHGPILPVVVGYDLVYGSANDAPPGSPAPTVVAIIDTGADSNCVDEDLAISLNLPKVGESTVSAAHGTMAANVYRGQIFIPELDWTLEGRLLGVSFGAEQQQWSVILGRTFLQHCVMNYDGRTGAVTVSTD